MSKHLDWSRITPDVAVWCKTEEEDLAFRQACEERGITWISGRKPTSKLFFNEAGANHYKVENNRIWLADTQTATIIPYSDLLVEDKPTKSRLAEILGVEDDEEWNCGNATYRVHEGVRQHLKDNDWYDCEQDRGLLSLIRYPDLIIRKPRFTADELAMLRCFAAEGIKSINRWIDGRLTFVAENDGGVIEIGILPTVRPGDSITLAEVLK